MVCTLSNDDNCPASLVVVLVKMHRGKKGHLPGMEWTTKREVCAPKKRNCVSKGHAPPGVDYNEYRRTRKYDPFSPLQ